MFTGAITCLSMGLIAIVQNDIKRVIAFCTLSQLGYMMAAQGAGAYEIGMFHLLTHAMFKALLFLAAGSVIIALHHEQDIRKMGGLKSKMPITYVCMLIGAWALAAIPPFSGFFSKDLIIEAVKYTQVPGHMIAYYLILACAFVTSFYIFRMLFIVFHGKSRLSENIASHVKETGWSIRMPLILLSVFSIIIGGAMFTSILAGQNGVFGNTILPYMQNFNHGEVMSVTDLLSKEKYTSSIWAFILHSVYTLPFWLAISAVLSAYILYVIYPTIPKRLVKGKTGINLIYYILDKKYFIDGLYDVVFRQGTILLSKFCWYVIDMFIIDRMIVTGVSNVIYSLGSKLRKFQRGYLFDYALVLIIGLVLITLWLIFLIN